MEKTSRSILNLFTFILLFFFVFSQKVFALENGNFESGEIIPWDAYSGALVSITNEQFHGGSKSAKVVNTSVYSYGIQQLVTGIEEGKVYRFSGFVKITDTYVAKVLLRIGWYKDGAQKGSNVDSDPITTVGDWRELSVTGTAPSAVNSLKVRAVLSSTTDDMPSFAYFDDLVFEETELPSPTPTLTPTPTQIPPTSTPIPTDTPAPSSYSNIYISEFMANPSSGEEWVELYNNNDFEVNLWGWYIDDIVEGGSSPKSISGTISAKSYKQFFISDSYFNNDGDDVRLLDGGKNEKDKKSFSSSTKGKSWSKDSSGDWCQTDPTPNSPNPGCPSSTSPPTPTNTPSLTPTKTPTPIKTPTPSPTVAPTETGELSLAGETSGNSSILGAQVSPTKAPQSKQRFKITAGLFIFSGLILLGISIFFLLKEKLIQSNNLNEKI